MCEAKASTAKITDQPSRQACCLVLPVAMSACLHLPAPRRGSCTPGNHNVAPQPSGPPSVTRRPPKGKAKPLQSGAPLVSSRAHSISRSSNRGRIIGLRRVAISTVLCAQNCNSRSASCENFTTSSHSCAPSMPPVCCCKALDSNFTLKIAGFHHMSLPTTL